MIIVFYIIVLIFSVIIHEVSHGYVALKLGDTTARDAGRLTLNPLKHLDPFWSVILPLILALSHLPVVGMAKPVPYDPRFLKNPKQAAGLIALAGPVSNLLLAIIFAIFVRVLVGVGMSSAPMVQLFYFLNIIIQTNVALAFFNLIPIPPLDGSGILFSFLPRQFAQLENFLRRYGFFILIIIIAMGVGFLSPLIVNTHMFLVGPQAAALLI